MLDIHESQPWQRKTSKSEMELVEQEKQEIKLVGKFIRRKGLNLYSYDPKSNSFNLVDTMSNDTAKIEINENKIGINSQATEKLQVLSTNIYFEALNQKSAEKRLQKFKNGSLQDLCNLRPFKEPKPIHEFLPEVIKLFIL